eukprot:COSAG06_NODE_25103_length_645_cov_0.836996_2_plen_56_part_01
MPLDSVTDARVITTAAQWHVSSEKFQKLNQQLDNDNVECSIHTYVVGTSLRRAVRG